MVCMGIVIESSVHRRKNIPAGEPDSDGSGPEVAMAKCPRLTQFQSVYYDGDDGRSPPQSVEPQENRCRYRKFDFYIAVNFLGQSRADHNNLALFIKSVSQAQNGQSRCHYHLPRWI